MTVVLDIDVLASGHRLGGVPGHIRTVWSAGRSASSAFASMSDASNLHESLHPAPRRQSTSRHPSAPVHGVTVFEPFKDSDNMKWTPSSGRDEADGIRTEVT